MDYVGCDRCDAPQAGPFSRQTPLLQLRPGRLGDANRMALGAAFSERSDRGTARGSHNGSGQSKGLSDMVPHPGDDLAYEGGRVQGNACQMGRGIRLRRRNVGLHRPIVNLHRLIADLHHSVGSLHRGEAGLP